MNTKSHFSNRFRPALVGASMAFLFVLAVVLAGCKTETKVAAAPPRVPVVVTNVGQENVPVQVTAIGNVEPYSNVQVKSMVTAQVMSVHFTQGQDVKKGQLLFTLDPRTFQADLAKAQGQLAKDVAAAANAQVQAKRYAALFKEGVVAREQFDQVQSSADQMAAAVDADKAAVESAKVNLQYTKIYSPINGRTGDVMIKAGNLVKANDLPLVVLNQVEPIYASFSIPERNLADVKKYMRAGSLKVQAAFNDPGLEPAKGKLDFINNTVDPATGTIQMKAVFPNTDRKLWPGQFVNVTLTLTTLPNAVVVPSQAVQAGQQGNYVFVIKSDKTAEPRNVSLGAQYGNALVVKSGLAPGETVVVDGQSRLAAGTKVDARISDGAPQASSETAETNR
jgi:membrane fusion protein, multidrug efflux system